MITKERVKDIILAADGKKIAVIGDVMLDRYFWGTVTRVSPEAPVPVIDLEEETWHLGGAANVALNLKTLGIQPVLCGLIGDDKNGTLFKELANDSWLLTDGLFSDHSRPTTVKMRIIGNNQQIARLDKESRDEMSADGMKFILDALRNIDGLSGIIMEDYNKGVINKNLIEQTMAFAKENNIPVFVDPKFNNFFEYKGATLFKPNKKEAGHALGYDLKNDSDIIRAAKEILTKLDCQSTLITLGAEGMMLLEKNQIPFFDRAKAKNVADVSGAGDTCIATFAMAVTGGATLKEATVISNYASSVVVSEPGIIAIQKNILLDNFDETY
ncbi:MAG: PfkB family carbohydrate kinase [bacterium]